MKTKNLLLSIAALALLTILPAVAQAGPVTLSLTPPGSVAQGSTLSIFGTITNTSAPTVFLNSIAANLVSPPSPDFAFDYTPFFTFVPVSLSAGANSGSVNLFDILVGAGVAPGTYTFTTTLLGGTDDGADNTLTTEDFTITVTEVPEPASMLLLGSGLAGVAALRRRRRQKADDQQQAA
jgi:hypothetical protein